MPLTPADRDRLAKLLAMFSSTFDGEIVNAARAAERLIKARGETWESVIADAHGVAPPRPKTKPHQPKSYRSDFQDEIDGCLEKGRLLTPWEQEFLVSISDRMTLSEKQRAILDRIKAKIEQYKGMDW